MKFVDKLTFNNETYEIRDSAARDILTQQGENIAEIDGRQQVMRSEINSLQTRMGEAEQDILNNSASIADIEDAIDVMDNDIDSNTGRITALEARVDECEDINTAQQVEINNIKNRVTTAEGNINVINGNISDINTSLDAIAAVDSQQTAQINQNKADITTLKNRANAADSRMDAMDTRMDGIDTTIADLDDRIVASTYEAGEGIYFGQGEEHTNINVEDELLDEIHQNTQDVADLKDKVDNLEDRVDDVEDDIDDIKGDITTIQGDITSIQGDITNIQGDITTIQGDVSDMHTIVNNISNTVTNIQAEIAVHDEDIEKLKESAKCNVITVEYAPVGGVWTYEAQDTPATILRYIEEYKAKSATAQSDYIDHKDIIVNVSQGPYSYPDMVGIINNYSKPLYIYETSVDYVVCFINNTNWSTGFDNDDYELVSLIVTTGQTPTITFQTYNWNAKLQPLSQAITSMVAQVNGNTAAINTIGNTLSTMQTNITSMQGDITTIQGNITNINSDITNINGDITNINGDIATIQGDVTTAQGDITALQSDVDDIDKRTHVHTIPLTITSTGDPPTFTTTMTATEFDNIVSDYNENGGQIIAVISDGTSSLNPPYVGNCNLISIEGYNTGSNSGRVGDHFMVFETADNDHYSQKYYITIYTKEVISIGKTIQIRVRTVDPFIDYIRVSSSTDWERLYNTVINTDMENSRQFSHIPLVYYNSSGQWQVVDGYIKRNGTNVIVIYKYDEEISTYGLEHYKLVQVTMTSSTNMTTSTIDLGSDTKNIKYYQELCGISRNTTGTTQDLDGLVEPGRWNVDTSSSTTNIGFPADVDPTTTNHWIVENTSSVVTFGFVSTSSVIMQTLLIKDNPGVFYRRSRRNNVWDSWYKFTGAVVT